MKKLTVILTSLLLLLCCIPCNIFADATYIIFNSGTTKMAYWNPNYIFIGLSDDVRAVSIKNGSTVYVSFVSDSPFKLSASSSKNEDYIVTPTVDASAITYNNSTYYVGYNSYAYNAYENQIEWYIDIPLYDKVSSLTNERTAIYYTYGEGAIDPDPEIEWGMLLDIGFSTSLATNGDRQLEYNVDHFYWNNRIDSHGNEFIDTCKVEIYASSIYYYGAGYIPLINSTMYNFTGTADYLAYKVLATAESASKSWGAVATGLSLSMGDLKPFAEGEDWYQYGWIYKIRLIEETSGYVGPWQILHTITSLPPSQNENVYNSTTINQTVINAIEIVNTINQEQNTVNNETNYHTENWTINETVINSGNQPEYPGIPELINYEDDFGADLTNDLQDLDLETPFSFLNGTGMQNALHWIRQVHLETIEQTELLTPLLVTMLVGLAVYLIGRRRG